MSEKYQLALLCGADAVPAYHDGRTLTDLEDNCSGSLEVFEFDTHEEYVAALTVLDTVIGFMDWVYLGREEVAALRNGTNVYADPEEDQEEDEDDE